MRYLISLHAIKDYLNNLLICRLRDVNELEELPWRDIFSHETNMVLSASNLGEIPYPDVTKQAISIYVKSDEDRHLLSEEIGGIANRVIRDCLGNLDPNIHYVCKAMDAHGTVEISERGWHETGSNIAY